MPLKIYQPGPPLSDHIQMMWSWGGYHVSHPAERILPNGAMEITFNLGNAFCVYDPQQSNAPITIAGGMFIGARSRHFIIDTRNPASLVSVWFKPGGALPFMGVTGSALHNLHVPLADIWGQAGHDLHEMLWDAPTPDAQFRILEATLQERLRTATPRHQAVGYALTHLHRRDNSQTIADLVDAVALSPTRFIQVFREDVGMTPKQFERVQRLRFALAQIANQSWTTWVDLALACGYYDQAHFINDFRSFTGITPTDYAPQSRDHHMNIPVYEMG
ncbi:MAG: AraC family transcriptional regulator [Chloroflexota bacterium]